MTREKSEKFGRVIALEGGAYGDVREAARQQLQNGRKLLSVIVMHGDRILRIDDMTKMPTTEELLTALFR